MDSSKAGRLEELVAAARKALRADRAVSQAKQREILKARAEALAVKPEAPELPGQPLDLLEFRMAGELYAVQSAFVEEVVALSQFIPIPGTPDFVLGIVDIRGRIVALNDLRIFFGMPADALHERDKIVVLHGAGMEMGLLANEIAGARTVPREQIEHSMASVMGPETPHVLGLTREGTIVLDTKLLLAEPAFVVHEAPS